MKGSRRIVLALAVMCATTGFLVETLSAQRTEESVRVDYRRPDAQHIRDEARDILAQRRFTRRQSFWEWLRSKLPDFELGGWGLSPTVAGVLLWIVVVWCVLALLAILVHMVWTLATVFGGRSASDVAAGGQVDDPRRLGYEQLCELMRRMAGDGRFREALGAMMLALLRWLDRSGLVAFHQSKTNGDYLREYPDNNPAEGTFRRFAVSFDLLIYGGGSCGDDAYRRMAGLFEEVQRYARRQ